MTRSSFARQHSAAFSRERRWALRLNEHLEADGPDVFHHACIDIYGNYAIKLLRLQGEMIQTFDRYRRGNKQTVEVRHMHIHSGAQGMIGIVNAGEREGDG